MKYQPLINRWRSRKKHQDHPDAPLILPDKPRSHRKSRAVKRRRVKRRVMVTLGGLTMCMVAPSCIFQVVLYRQNLAAAHEPLPQAPTFTPHDRLLVLAPHCDDETLGVGGTIAAARAMGAAVRIVFLTNGDSSVSTKIGEEARTWHRHSYRQLVRIRQREARAAMHTLGVEDKDIVFLGYPDCGTKEMWEVNWSPDHPYRSPATGASRSPYANSFTQGAVYCGQQALSDVRQIVEAWQPTVIFTTHPSDTHPDHWAAYAYADAALQSLRLNAHSRNWASHVRLMTFLVHRGLWPAPHGYHPDEPLSPPANLRNLGTQWVQMPLTPKARAAKEAALKCYASQLTFTPQFLRGFLRKNELLGIVPVVIDRLPAGVTSSADIIPAVVQDPVRDSLLHDVWPAADLHTVVLASPRDPATLTLRTQMAAAPSASLRYRLVLHAMNRIEPFGATEKVDAWLVEITANGSHLYAILTPADRSTSPLRLTARLAGRGFEVDLPRTALHLTDDAAVMVSSTTRLGPTILDQTETGTLRILPAEPVATTQPQLTVQEKGSVPPATATTG
jgi:LmbE family N-acetylglucosaminyl deacetylase